MNDLSLAIPIACQLTAIPAAEREAHQSLSQQLFSSVLEHAALPNGYAFRLPVASAVIRDVGAFIANERLCCPFLRFELTLEAGGTALWLRLSGDEAVKAFIAAEFASLLA